VVLAGSKCRLTERRHEETIPKAIITAALVKRLSDYLPNMCSRWEVDLEEGFAGSLNCCQTAQFGPSGPHCSGRFGLLRRMLFSAAIKAGLPNVNAIAFLSIRHHMERKAPTPRISESFVAGELLKRLISLAGMAPSISRFQRFSF